ncbi:MAG: CPBP family intramembrane metalloprotease [Deltaproteobacteria bacterium]|nr:CPBP family intramembrane metalloprotease [Deltaproteobacteria bacterium]
MTTSTLPAPSPRTQLTRRHAFLALLLVAPIPSLASLVGSLSPEGAWGVAAWMGSKAWLLALPLLWKLLVERRSLSASRPKEGGLGVGVALGMAIAAIIVGAYLLLGRLWIDPTVIRAAVEPFGLTKPHVYLGAVAYWVLFNSLMEEYVFRWFIASKAEELFAGSRFATVGAIALSALCFTGHHIIALSSYFDWRITLISSVGVFVGGGLWSALYLKYRSIWVPYISHAIVDVAVFAIGAVLIFG